MLETCVARKQTGRRGGVAEPVGARWRRHRAWWALAALNWVVATDPAVRGAEPGPLSPTAIVASPDGRQSYVACATANMVVVVDERGAVQRRIELPGPPSGLALSPDARRLAVTCAAPQSVVCVIDTERGRVITRIAAGHTAMAPVFGPDGNTLYVCNRYHHEVAVLDVKARRVLGRIGVEREPVAAALTRDGAHLL
ncbi:MAG: hypothetical protein FJ399_19305, partial [Verrucomicrobia bacterium]|nr:hypothetical protein [Verrucomicrobiota bacterium]